MTLEQKIHDIKMRIIKFRKEHIYLYQKEDNDDNEKTRECPTCGAVR